MEAMAAGIPVICDNHSGLIDRVNNETGWKCNDFQEQIAIIKSLTPEILEQKGKAAKEFARKNFKRELWIEWILGQHEEKEVPKEQRVNAFLNNTKEETDEWVNNQVKDLLRR